MTSHRAAAACFPAVTGTGGAVASAQAQATDAGLEILRAGGNAADAAVATALALVVVHPQAGNLGGGGFALVRFDDDVTSLDFREVAPAAATATMYQDEHGTAVPSRSLVGPLAAGVPGSPRGLWELHRRYGSLPWPEVVAPATALADEGFVVSERLSQALEHSRALLEQFPSSAAAWLKKDGVPSPGSRKRLPMLARTLRAYARDGPDALETGSAATALIGASQRYGGILAPSDLQDYRPVWRRPIRFEAYGWQVASMGLPSSGGIILAQTSELAQHLGYSQLPPHGAARAHLLAEIWRRSYADRVLLGDPHTTNASSQQLLSPAWLERRSKEISLRTATVSSQVQCWPGSGPVESTETTHLSVLDGDGNAVSLTTTLNGSFGCGLFVAELGYFLNNEMDDFAAAPGTPNLYGLVQGKANAVRPGKRMLSSMSPTIAWRSGEVIVLGSPGGSRIPTTTVQVLLNVIVDHAELQSAVNQPRIHHQWLPDKIAAEDDALAPEVAHELRSRGHDLEFTGAQGDVNAVFRDEQGVFHAAADPRGPSTAGVVVPSPGSSSHSTSRMR